MNFPDLAVTSKPGDRFVLVFESIHDAMAAEKAVLAEGIRAELVPTPRDLSSDCGMALCCPASAQEKITLLHNQGRLRFKSLHWI